MENIKTLNENFACGDQLVFRLNESGMPVVDVHNAFAQASIALQGAHVLSFVAQGQAPLIWMSEDATFAPGKSLRGGVPICWPWFGPHADDSSKPAHGFARTVDWKVVATESLNTGEHALTFELVNTPTTIAQTGHSLQVQLQVVIGATLKLSLHTTNLGDTPFVLGEALHTYFHVGDVRKVRIEGLDGCAYLDKVDEFKMKTQQGAITIDMEVDRIYSSQSKQCRIVDEVLNRVIELHSSGSKATVVWNPWQDMANKMGDLGEDGYLHMLCVENANAAKDVVELAAGATHSMNAEYAIQPL